VERTPLTVNPSKSGDSKSYIDVMIWADPSPGQQNSAIAGTTGAHIPKFRMMDFLRYVIYSVSLFEGAAARIEKPWQSGHESIYNRSLNNCNKKSENSPEF
jgi:hypothetical protein